MAENKAGDSHRPLPPPPWRKLIENAKDGTLLVLIPEGEFLAGGPGSNEGGGPFKVRLPGYYLALYPVTNGQYARFLTARKPNKADLDKWILLDEDCFVRSSGAAYEAYGGKDDYPVVQVSWFGAEAYCEWSGLRLPSELEWEKGARGTDGREYPWGKDWDQNKCRNDRNKGNERTCGIWSYPEGCSRWGCYQMAGNVWEWCADWYDSGAYGRYKNGNLTPPASGGARVVRGVSWSTLLRTTSAARTAAPTGRRVASTSTAFVVPGLSKITLCSFTALPFIPREARSRFLGSAPKIFYATGSVDRCEEHDFGCAYVYMRLNPPAAPTAQD